MLKNREKNDVNPKSRWVLNDVEKIRKRQDFAVLFCIFQKPTSFPQYHVEQKILKGQTNSCTLARNLFFPDLIYSWRSTLSKMDL